MGARLSDFLLGSPHICDLLLGLLEAGWLEKAQWNDPSQICLFSHSPPGESRLYFMVVGQGRKGASRHVQRLLRPRLGIFVISPSLHPIIQTKPQGQKIDSTS